MQLKISLLASAFLAATTLIAHAADMVSGTNNTPAPNTESVLPFSWDGIYGGIQGGYGFTNVNFDGTPQGYNGRLLGGFIGYNFDIGNNLILGAEFDITRNFNNRDNPRNDVLTSDFKTTGSVRGKVGYAFDHLLIYGAAGYSKAEGNITFQDQFGIQYRGGTTFSGLTLGVGADYAITDNIFTRLEYRHNKYDQGLQANVPYDLNQNVVALGVGVKLANSNISFDEAEHGNPSSFNWGGIYGGLQGGYGLSDANFIDSQNYSGGVLTGFAGYNFDTGYNVILGAEADISRNFNEKNNVLAIAESDFNTMGSIRGRVGYSVNRALFYGTAGWNKAKFSYNDTLFNLIQDDAIVGGPTFGAGVDYAVTDNVFVRGEYRHNIFRPSNVPNINLPIDLSQNVISVGIGLKY